MRPPCIASERAPNEMFIPLPEAALGPVPNGKGLDLGHYLTHALEPVPIVSDTSRVTSSSWLMYVVLRGVGSSPLTNSYQTLFHPHKPCKPFHSFSDKGIKPRFPSARVTPCSEILFTRTGLSVVS
jgi:hypothetical protein